MPSTNIVVWFDIPTDNFDRAVKFYSDILGTPIKVDTFMGQKLGFFPMEPGSGGDIVPPNPNHKPSSQGTRIYLNCADKLDEVASRVAKAGGKILQPKFAIGENMGYIVMIADSEGNHVGLHGSN
jgi:uncharacterized protein